MTNLGEGQMHRTCDQCQAVGPVGSAKFMMNIGLLVARFEQTRSGQFCSGCLWKNFWSYTFGNLILGPWGVKSFFIMPMFFFSNITELLSARQVLKRQAALAPPSPG